MEKSFNDIEAQLQRVVALANKIGGKYIENAARRVNVQHFAQIAARTRTQHGISLFSTDKEEKKPFIYKPEPKAEPVTVQAPEPKPVELHKVVPMQPGTGKPRRELTPEEDMQYRKKLQECCRHDFIIRMYRELLADLNICKLEGWDIYEFPSMIRR